MTGTPTATTRPRTTGIHPPTTPTPRNGADTTGRS